VTATEATGVVAIAGVRDAMRLVDDHDVPRLGDDAPRLPAA